MRHNIVTWPKRVKSVPVSATISPVTHVAEVAVKKASVHKIGLAESLSASTNNTAPTMIKAAKKIIGKTNGAYEWFVNLIILPTCRKDSRSIP